MTENVLSVSNSLHVGLDDAKDDIEICVAASTDVDDLVTATSAELDELIVGHIAAGGAVIPARRRTNLELLANDGGVEVKVTTQIPTAEVPALAV